MPSSLPSSLQQQLILDELFDLSLYRSFQRHASPSLNPLLESLAKTEVGHLTFWQDYFGITVSRLDARRRAKLAIFQTLASLFGDAAILFIVEIIEVHGVKKYLDLWRTTTDLRFRKGLRSILEDELVHEEKAVTELAGRTVDATTIRNIFLGFNDGSVEILGAVNGLVAALRDPLLVSAAGLTVSIAGAISMAAGAYVSTHSEAEIVRTEARKRAFLETAGDESLPSADVTPPSPLKAALIVGVAYLIGAAAPLAPFVFGVSSPVWSIVLSGSLILLVSAMLAFISGMRMRRRIIMNFIIVILATSVSYLFGLLAQRWFGI